MKKTTSHFALSVLALTLLSACTQTTPSMMNTSRIELARETAMEQIPLGQVTEDNIKILADQYRKYGSGPIDLTMTFDPTSKNFTAMKAVHALEMVKKTLSQNGVTNFTAQTLSVPNGNPSLMVSYDTLTAQAPSDCAPMPGLENRETGRFIGAYKFGCGVDTYMAKQLVRPADLEGTSDMDMRDARREAIVLDGYAAGMPREPLESPNTETINLNVN